MSAPRGRARRSAREQTRGPATDGERRHVIYLAPGRVGATVLRRRGVLVVPSPARLRSPSLSRPGFFAGFFVAVAAALAVGADVVAVVAAPVVAGGLAVVVAVGLAVAVAVAVVAAGLVVETAAVVPDGREPVDVPVPVDVAVEVAGLAPPTRAAETA